MQCLVLLWVSRSSLVFSTLLKTVYRKGGPWKITSWVTGKNIKIASQAVYSGMLFSWYLCVCWFLLWSWTRMGLHTNDLHILSRSQGSNLLICMDLVNVIYFKWNELPNTIWSVGFTYGVLGYTSDLDLFKLTGSNYTL